MEHKIHNKALEYYFFWSSRYGDIITYKSFWVHPALIRKRGTILMQKKYKSDQYILRFNTITI